MNPPINQVSPSLFVLLFASGIGLAGLVASLMIMNSKNKSKNRKSSTAVDLVKPERWIKVGTVSELIIYPVKSLPGIQVEEAVSTDLGFQDSKNPNLRDRTFLVTDSSGNFQRQTAIPLLALIHPSIKDDTIHLKFVGNEYNGEEELSVKFPKSLEKNKRTVRIWKDQVEVLDCGDEVGTWLTTVLGSDKELRLVYHEGTERQRTMGSDNRKWPMINNNKDTGAFQDETSYMLMTQESLDLLNSKMETKALEEGRPKPTPLDVRSLRPTIMVSGVADPFSEDHWGFIRIGEDDGKSPIFKVARPCCRCRLTVIDPDTGKFRDDNEPLPTLQSLKRPVGDAITTEMVKKAAVMGTHFGIFENENAIVRVGDPVYAALL